jgi:abortive infection bacteriophage resistance protein
MLKSAGRFFMAHYNKTYQAPGQLLALLKSRGLSINNSTRAEECLRRIGYYRFSGYLYPLLTIPKDRHIFKNGASFEQALNMYLFDSQLRTLVFSQIEKVEVAVRSAIVNITSRETGNPFWITEPLCFYDNNVFLKAKQYIDDELSKSKEDFIQHFRSSYSDPYPPSWMVAEILPFGVLTRIYDNIRSNQIRKQIAKEFSLSVPVFMSWLTIITVCRNNCCHHSRVWNRTFALRALSMRNMTQPWISVPVNQQKFFFSLCIIKYFLNIISPKNDMTDKLKTLLTAFPEIDTAAMGFPQGWENEPLWK